jgi:hypothetical protein
MEIEYHDIKAEELRIGNFFYPDVDGDAYAKITAKDILELYSDPIDDYYKALPLTEEWLIKFGFKKNSDNGDLKGNDCYYTHKNFKRCISLPNFIYDGIKIKYVHQLQNLYFALTGEELEVKNV